MDISSIARGFINDALSQAGGTRGSHSGASNPLGALSDAFGSGILGDVIGSAANPSSAGAFSLSNPNFGGLLSTGLQTAATAAFGPLGGIASGFLGKALGSLGKSGSGKGGLGGLGGAIGNALGGVASAIGDAVSSAFGGKSSTSKSSSSTSKSSSTSTSASKDSTADSKSSGSKSSGTSDSGKSGGS